MSIIDKVHIPKLKGSTNYIIWAVRMKAILTEKDLVNFIFEDSTSPKNYKALSNIQLYCDDGPLLYIRDLESAKQAWDRLEELYNPKGFTTEHLTMKELWESHLENFDTMEDYLNKVKYIIDNLRSKDIELPELVVMSFVINHLTDEYESFVSNITQAFRKDPKAYTMDTLFIINTQVARSLCFPFFFFAHIRSLIENHMKP